MSTLGDYPLVALCFHYINMDNNGTEAGEVDRKCEVPMKWDHKFRLANEALKDLAGKTVFDLVPKRVQDSDPIYKEIDGDDPDYNTALWCISNPVNDMFDQIAEGAGWSQDLARVVNDVLGEYFDGDLTSHFTLGGIR